MAALLLLDTAALHSLGPGAGPWRVEPPEAHGLNGTLLAAAAETAARLVPERFCLLVVKDGVIVHESTFVNRSDTQYESDSLAKTATALVVGAAVEAGLFELDVPLARYGVRPRCGGGAPQDCWRAHCPPGRPCPDGPLGFWPNVTARTLLSQSSGCVTGRGCFAEPCGCGRRSSVRGPATRIDLTCTLESAAAASSSSKTPAGTTMPCSRCFSKLCSTLKQRPPSARFTTQCEASSHTMPGCSACVSSSSFLHGSAAAISAPSSS